MFLCERSQKLRALGVKAWICSLTRPDFSYRRTLASDCHLPLRFTSARERASVALSSDGPPCRS